MIQYCISVLTADGLTSQNVYYLNLISLVINGKVFNHMNSFFTIGLTFDSVLFHRSLK